MNDINVTPPNTPTSSRSSTPSKSDLSYHDIENSHTSKDDIKELTNTIELMMTFEEKQTESISKNTDAIETYSMACDDLYKTIKSLQKRINVLEQQCDVMLVQRCKILDNENRILAARCSKLEKDYNDIIEWLLINDEFRANNETRYQKLEKAHKKLKADHLRFKRNVRSM